MSSIGYGGIGELLLAGRPTGAPVEIIPPVDLGYFGVSPVAARPLLTNQDDFGILTFSAQTNAFIKYHTVVLFNGKQVHHSGPTEENRKWKIDRHFQKGEFECSGDMAIIMTTAGAMMISNVMRTPTARLLGTMHNFPVTWSDAQACQALIRRPNNRNLEKCLVEVKFWKTIEQVVMTKQALLHPVLWLITSRQCR